MAGLRRVRYAAKAQPLIEAGREDRTLEGACRDRRREEEALIERGHEAEVRADLLAEAGRAETIGAALNEVFPPADIAADRRKTAAGVLDEGAHDHVRANVGGLDRLDELAVAVIDHADDVGLDALAESDELPDLLHGEGRARGIALRALDGDELGALIDGPFNGGIVERAVRPEIRLRIRDAVLLQRADTLADADDLLKRVIRCADGGQKLVAGQEVRTEGDGERMCAAGDLRPDERCLGMKRIGIDALEIVAPVVVVAVARRGGKVAGADTVSLHGEQHLVLIIFRATVDLPKAVGERGEYFLPQRKDLGRDAERLIHLLIVHDHAPFPKQEKNSANGTESQCMRKARLIEPCFPV